MAGRRRNLSRVLSALAWVSVGLSIPMASFAIYGGIHDARWEEVDRQWEIDDKARFERLMAAISATREACGGYW